MVTSIIDELGFILFVFCLTAFRENAKMRITSVILHRTLYSLPNTKVASNKQQSTLHRVLSSVFSIVHAIVHENKCKIHKPPA